MPYTEATILEIQRQAVFGKLDIQMNCEITCFKSWCRSWWISTCEQNTCKCWTIHNILGSHYFSIATWNHDGTGLLDKSHQVWPHKVHWGWKIQAGWEDDSISSWQKDLPWGRCSQGRAVFVPGRPHPEIQVWAWDSRHYCGLFHETRRDMGTTSPWPNQGHKNCLRHDKKKN